MSWQQQKFSKIIVIAKHITMSCLQMISINSILGLLNAHKNKSNFQNSWSFPTPKTPGNEIFCIIYISYDLINILNS